MRIIITFSPRRVDKRPSRTTKLDFWRSKRLIAQSKRTNDDLFFIVILFICLYFHKDNELNDYLCSYS